MRNPCSDAESSILPGGWVATAAENTRKLLLLYPLLTAAAAAAVEVTRSTAFIESLCTHAHTRTLDAPCPR